MRKISRYLSLFIATVSAGCVLEEADPGLPAVAASSQAATVAPAPYIVVFKPGVDAARGAAVRAQAQGQGAQVEHTYQHVFRGFSATLPPAAVAALQAHPDVALVEPDGVVSASTTQTSPTWGLDRIDQRSLPFDQSYSTESDGSGVHVFVIDSGIRSTHAEFGGRVQTAPGEIFNTFTKGPRSTSPEDCNGHGTHVAGTIGSATYGVAKAVTLHNVRVLDCNGDGTDAGVIAGIDWVTNWKNTHPGVPAVANMSLGGGLSQTLNLAVTRSINAGVTYAVAAGNDYYADACTQSPASTPAAITVGSSTNEDKVSEFSNIGECLDIFGPGTAITSTWFLSNTATNTISGTSMATPHVAGVAALYLSQNPSATPQQVRDQIVSTGSGYKLTGVPDGTPNLLLYSPLNNLDGGTGWTPPPPPVPTELTNNVTVTALEGATASRNYYKLTVPAGAATVRFDTSGGTGDVDMYVKRGALPTTVSYDCRPYQIGNTETCNPEPQAGDYFVMLHGYAAYTGVSLLGAYTMAPPPSAFVLSSQGVQPAGKTGKTVSLKWTGGLSGATSVDVYRDGVKHITTANDGFQNDTINRKSGTVSYRICGAGAETDCSNTLVVTL